MSNVTLRLAYSSIALGLLSGCSNGVVIPDAEFDSAPDISVSAFPSGGPSSGVEDDPVNSSGRVRYIEGTDLLFTASATNSGGVKSFSFTATDGVETVTPPAVNTTPDASGLVPDLLSILAKSNGDPILFQNADTIIEVETEAENFNGQTSNVDITYVPYGPMTGSIGLYPPVVNSRTEEVMVFWTTTYADAVRVYVCEEDGSNCNALFVDPTQASGVITTLPIGPGEPNNVDTKQIRLVATNWTGQELSYESGNCPPCMAMFYVFGGIGTNPLP